MFSLISCGERFVKSLKSKSVIFASLLKQKIISWKGPYHSKPICQVVKDHLISFNYVFLSNSHKIYTS